MIIKRDVHNDRKVNCHPVTESSDSTQLKLSGFFVQSCAAGKHANLALGESEPTSYVVDADGLVSKLNQTTLAKDKFENESEVGAVPAKALDESEIDELNPSIGGETDELNQSQFIRKENTEKAASITPSQTTQMSIKLAKCKARNNRY